MDNQNDNFIKVSLPEYLKQLLTAKKLVKSEVIARTCLDKIYVYQIFDGKRAATRKKILALALAMYLTHEECNYLLRYANCATLYPKIRFDAIIIFALKDSLSVMDTNEILYDYGLEILE